MKDGVKTQMFRFTVGTICILIALILQVYYQVQIVPLKRDYAPEYTTWTVFSACVIRPVFYAGIVWLLLSLLHRKIELPVAKATLVVSGLVVALTVLLCVSGLFILVPDCPRALVQLVVFLDEHDALFCLVGVCCYIITKRMS